MAILNTLHLQLLRCAVFLLLRVLHLWLLSRCIVDLVHWLCRLIHLLELWRRREDRGWDIGDFGFVDLPEIVSVLPGPCLG